LQQFKQRGGWFRTTGGDDWNLCQCAQEFLQLCRMGRVAKGLVHPFSALVEARWKEARR